MFPCLPIVTATNMRLNQSLNYLAICTITICALAQTVWAQKQPLKDSINKYYIAGLYAKAIPFAKAFIVKLEKDHKPESKEVSGAQNVLGDLLTRTNEYADAEAVLLKALNNRKQTLGLNHLLVGEVHNNLGNLYKATSDAEKSEFHFLEALRIRKSVLGNDHIDVATTSSNLGVLYLDLGKYEMADEMYQLALGIRLKTLGENSKDVASSYNNLGILYWRSGKLPKAEEFHEKSLKIRQKLFGESHPLVAHSLNNLGLVYIFMGNLPKAETFLLRSLEMKRKIYGDNNLDVAESYNNLGNLTKNLGKYIESADFSLKSLRIKEAILEPNHPDIGGSYNNLGELHWTLGNYYLAEQYHKKALEICTNSYGSEHIEVAGSYLNLGNLYADQGKLELASEYYNRALNIRRKVFGEGHPELANPYHDEAINLQEMGNMSKAELFFNRSKDIYLEQVRQFFPAFSDEEKEGFFATLTPNIDAYQSFAVARYAENRDMAAQLYDLQLTTKALLMNSSAKWKHRIKSSGDKKLFLRFTEWESLQNQLANLLQSPDSTERLALDSIKAMSEKSEKELSLRSENFAQLADRHQPTWQEVQQQLKSGEAAIEIIRIHRNGIQRIVTDTSSPAKPTYYIKGLSDSAQYAALILKAGTKMPELVLLANGTELEGKHLNYYQNCVKQKLEDRESYDQYWKRIGEKLKGINRIYFSPDGVYLNLNLNILQNPKTKKFIIDEKDIHLVTVTKDLLPTNKSEQLNKLACLVGFPNYYQSHDQVVSTAATERKSPTLRYGMKLDASEVLAELPQTKVEVEKIADLLSQAGWEVKSYLANEAIEENLKESYKPRLLHIATHGYFQPKDGEVSNPLLRSGLMLAGAGTTLRSGNPEKREDGILTAYEAMNLNLDNTDLVVLSACETGLGEIKNGEGVYGLQRAFKVAGAKTIIMSLWKVSDEATQELMVSFYKHWLGAEAVVATRQTAKGEKAVWPKAPTASNTKRVAFLKAQKELKAKYPNPYYWGAFVMVGE